MNKISPSEINFPKFYTKSEAESNDLTPVLVAYPTFSQKILPAWSFDIWSSPSSTSFPSCYFLPSYIFKFVWPETERDPELDHQEMAKSQPRVHDFQFPREAKSNLPTQWLPRSSQCLWQLETPTWEFFDALDRALWSFGFSARPRYKGSYANQVVVFKKDG